MLILDAKTDYSFMRGFGKADAWLERCKETGSTVFGVADYCSTWGHAAFHKTFKGSGVRLLYGVQLPVCNSLDKNPTFSLVTLIAKEKLDELYKLVTLAHEQTYYRPRLTWRQVMDVKDCVVIANNILPTHILTAKKACHYEGLSDGTNPCTNLPKVLAYGPRFPSPQHRKGYNLVSAISRGFKIGEDDPHAYHMFRNRGEAETVLGRLPEEAEENAEAISSSCVADINYAELMYLDGDLEGMARSRAIDLGVNLNDAKYEERLQRELAVIREKKFEPYFYFITDLMDWAKERMFIGPGRGSSGGSLLCFLLGITTVDPIKFGTLFERFIDITRPDWPDIDIDFPDVRRDEVFAYLKEKYVNVAKLGTLTEFGGKSALNDTGRACSIPWSVTREVGRYTESGMQGKTLSPAWVFENVQEVEGLVKKYPDLLLATQIDGHIRHHGVHPAGIVVTTDEITNYGALDRNGVISLDMKSAEAVGLIKMDALGLKTLSVIQECCDLAGLNPKNLYSLDWDDISIYDEIFNSDLVTGIFQFEGKAVRALSRQITLSKFDDMCAITSLARPGPLMGGAAANWVKAHKGEEEPRELHASLVKTFGTIIYQEQAMSIVRDIAGFSEPEVNGFRRAVGKKDPEQLRSYREKFLKGATKHFEFAIHKAGNSHDHLLDEAREAAAELWDELCEFGEYAFNYSHSVAYCMISFMCAWLKKHHPLEFAVASLRHAKDDEQGRNILRELTEAGYKWFSFDPEVSQATWAVVDGKLYGGFDSLHGVGTKTAQAIFKKRTHVHWMDDLTDTQRKRLLAPTPWDNLTHFKDHYSTLYKDPNGWRGPGIPMGIKGHVTFIRDIPEGKGSYAFLARITDKQKKDHNEPDRVAKRDGQIYDKNSEFLNLTFEDDTGEIRGTINRFKTPEFMWIMKESMEGRDFLIRANVIHSDSRWIFVDNLVELK